MARQQFNVNLDPELVRRVKHHAIDVQQSASELVGRVLELYLTSEPKMTTSPKPSPSPGLALQPMVHVEQMSPSVAFYEALGGTVLHGSRDGDFVMMRIGEGQLGLLAHPPNPEQNEGLVELNFESAEDLDKVQDRLVGAGVRIVQPVTDEGFGRQLQVATPDGLLVKINSLEQELYT